MRWQTGSKERTVEQAYRWLDRAYSPPRTTTASRRHADHRAPRTDARRATSLPGIAYSTELGPICRRGGLRIQARIKFIEAAG